MKTLNGKRKLILSFGLIIIPGILVYLGKIPGDKYMGFLKFLTVTVIAGYIGEYTKEVIKNKTGEK